ncbi:hypothetical protein [Neptuniibacter sp. QD37_11]|uniref:hypothetical protein n=1 Tax=Neptuniibacter sp. QD37_11 TaxID=3398209 RepID=UPI0039F53706
MSVNYGSGFIEYNNFATDDTSAGDAHSEFSFGERLTGVVALKFGFDQTHGGDGYMQVDEITIMGFEE